MAREKFQPTFSSAGEGKLFQPSTGGILENLTAALSTTNHDVNLSIEVTFIVTFVLTALIVLGFAYLWGRRSNTSTYKTEIVGKDAETYSKRSKHDVIAVVESKPHGCITCKNNEGEPQTDRTLLDTNKEDYLATTQKLGERDGR